MFHRLNYKHNKLLLLSFLLIILSIIFSYYRNFNWFTDSLSDFGLINNFFNFSLIISGISLGLFTLWVIKKGKNTNWCRIFLLWSSISLIFIGIFTKKYLIHFVFAISLFSVFPFGLFFYANTLKNNNFYLSLFTKIVALFLIIIWVLFFFIWLYIIKLGLAIPEIISLCCWIIWSIIFIKNFKTEHEN